ncbi:hypothetical protein SanaruYs_06780 [Chryseotalea sanaruensis]|uniref:Uncharacterized protein n=1 Tax=Chryseotalea sanaruensis TaxID=2482724 RepID=A0A401U6C3_9BACT|nr:hypothetical protein [Chryseotalea sanaruensis]GCC50463.1 hypothetical protein SanaruYs_06780 [Chryseotalea sanaruensis]
MEKPKDLPGKEAPSVEEPITNPVSPVIETPEPPQIIDPSAPPDIERKKITPPREKRKGKPLKTSSRVL